MDMNAEALSYYWHLRAQGVSPDAAREHARQRFGVAIGALIPARDCTVRTDGTDTPSPEFKPVLPDWVKNGETIFGTISTPQQS